MNDDTPTLPPPTDALVQWLSFLAADRLDEHDLAAVSAALANEGPLAELTAIEARQAVAHLSSLDTVGRAQAWLAQRSTIDLGEQTSGTTRVVGGVLHRRDPVLVGGDWPDRPVITERSVGDWLALRHIVSRLAGHPEAPVGERGDLRSSVVDATSLDVVTRRHRVAQAPIARAAIVDSLRSAESTEVDRLSHTAAQLDLADLDAVDSWIGRLWLVAELRRLGRVGGTRPGRTRPTTG